jgi:Protein of unknown function (DUF3431)
VEEKTLRSISEGRWTLGTGSVTTELLPGGNWGFEASAYLYYIVRNYFALPNYIATVHGAGGHGHWKKYGSKNVAAHSNRIFKCINPAYSQGYMSTADDNYFWHRFHSSHYLFLEKTEKFFLKRATEKEKLTYYAHPVWQTFMSSDYMIAFMGNAEFIVQRELIYKLPFNYWVALLNATLDRTKTDDFVNKAYRNNAAKYPAWMLEPLWHTVFGYPGIYPRPPVDSYCGSPGALYLDESVCPESLCAVEDKKLLNATRATYAWVF